MIQFAGHKGPYLWFLGWLVYTPLVLDSGSHLCRLIKHVTCGTNQIDPYGVGPVRAQLHLRGPFTRKTGPVTGERSRRKVPPLHQRRFSGLRRTDCQPQAGGLCPSAHLPNGTFVWCRESQVFTWRLLVLLNTGLPARPFLSMSPPVIAPFVAPLACRLQGWFNCLNNTLSMKIKVLS